MPDDTTTARRQLLGLLIDRVEQDGLLGAETPLLRPLIEAEQAGTSPRVKITMHDETTSAAVRPLLHDLDARRHELADVLLRSSDAPWPALIGQAAILQADNARLYQELDALTAAQPPVVSDLLVQHDVTRKALAGALGAGWHLNWEQLVDRARRTNETAMGTADAPPTAACCTARYMYEPGEIWTCTLNPGHNGDHVDASDGTRYWNDHVGFHPDTDAPPTDPPVVARCSPLINPACPGHTDADRCERAASPAPDHQPQHALHEEQTA